MKKKSKLKSIPKLVKELDAWFSRWVRLSHADKNGMVKCFTSGKMYHWKEIQAGHYVSRRHYSLRWDEKNVKPQSVADNIYNQGNSPAFANGLIQLYGHDIIQLLLIKKETTFKLERFTLETLIQEYKTKVENHPLWGG